MNMKLWTVIEGGVCVCRGVCVYCIKCYLNCTTSNKEELWLSQIFKGLISPLKHLPMVVIHERMFHWNVCGSVWMCVFWKGKGEKQALEWGSHNFPWGHICPCWVGCLLKSPIPHSWCIPTAFIRPPPQIPHTSMLYVHLSPATFTKNQRSGPEISRMFVVSLSSTIAWSLTPNVAQQGHCSSTMYSFTLHSF